MKFESNFETCEPEEKRLTKSKRLVVNRAADKFSSSNDTDMPSNSTEELGLEEAQTMVEAVKQRFASRDSYLDSWLRSHLGSHIIRQGGVLASDAVLMKAAGKYLAREKERRRKALGFRLRRKQRAKLQKNKNRQVAARQRVRDGSGKFQGGLQFRRPKIIFLVTKTSPATQTAPSPQVNFDSQPSKGL